MRTFLIALGAVAALAFGAFVLDWLILGKGPVTSYAVGQCVDAEAGSPRYVPSKRLPTNGELAMAPTTRGQAKATCEDAARDGTLNLKGGIDN